MVGQLRAPPVGFQEVTVRHFAMCRQRIVVQARRWMIEARGTNLYPRYERSYAELLSLLNTESMSQFECLPPLPEDVEALVTVDAPFAGLISCNRNGDGRHINIESNEDVKQEDSNPWADYADQEGNPWSATSVPAGQVGNDDESSDDELYH